MENDPQARAVSARREGEPWMGGNPRIHPWCEYAVTMSDGSVRYTWVPVSANSAREARRNCNTGGPYGGETRRPSYLTAGA